MVVDRVAVIAFAKAVLTGAFAAAAPVLVLTVPFGLVALFDFDDPMGGARGLLIAAVFPLIITLPIVLGASILIGLPLTYLLSRAGRDQGELYVVAGLFFGGVLPVAISILAGQAAGGLFYFAIPGSLGGAVTGWSWGRYRDALNLARHTEHPDLEPTL